ncbi:MAG: tRNA pseudouridine(38-40) synthase TruA [Desulfocapsaceae bacterium]|nr:tRNA pseudouridine(38-40) synthase TruA [Desulfocapsaceae bacterium]
MKTIRLLIAFDGTDFHGWQLQPDAPTIQGEIEKHIFTIHNRHTTLHGAGRTDAGVHATGMVAHFHSEKNLSCSAWKQALNSMLPASIRILEATEEGETFHARFSAKSKTYTYSIFNGEILLPQQRLYTVHIRLPLNFTAMEDCLPRLVGTHDFSSFESAGSRDPIVREQNGSTRTITDATIIHHDNNFHSFTITGDGFLRHMVRNIVGTLLEVGLARRTVQSFGEAIQEKKRAAAGATAPAHGLTLTKIRY